MNRLLRLRARANRLSWMRSWPFQGIALQSSRPTDLCSPRVLQRLSIYKRGVWFLIAYLAVRSRLAPEEIAIMQAMPS